MRYFFLFFTYGFLHRQLVALVSFDIPDNLVLVASGVTLIRVHTLLAYCKCEILFKRCIINSTYFAYNNILNAEISVHKDPSLFKLLEGIIT